jgi:hypothetical protein
MDNLSSHTRKALPDLQREIEAWNQKMNRDRTLIDWRFTRAKARQKFRYKRNDIMRSWTWRGADRQIASRAAITSSGSTRPVI